MKTQKNVPGPKSMVWLMLALLVALAAGCSDATGTPAGTTATTLGVALTDAPGCGFDAVNVTIVKVRVHKSDSVSDSDSGWTDITLNPARKINLLNLNNGVLTTLGETPITPGHYTQLRLILDPNTNDGLSNSVVPMNGIETALVTPSAVRSGIKLINHFDVALGERVDLVLDFDACKSVIKRGNGTYALKPVIKVLPYALNGIGGFVHISLLGNSVTVTAQQNGIVIQATAPNILTGEFFLSRLAPGNYDIALTANGHGTAVIAGTPVASNTSVTMISNKVTPISLPASTNHVISGTAMLSPANSAEVVYVTAKQTFGTTVTVKFVAADDTAPGAYALTLPLIAPMLGQYHTTLPIALTAQSDAAGKYAVVASAIGYQSQSADKDISAADATESFVLVP